MKIIVKVKPSAKVEKVERIDQDSLPFAKAESKLPVYKVSVKEPPVDDRANMAVILALAKYFDVPRSRIRLTSGTLSKQKTFRHSFINILTFLRM